MGVDWLDMAFRIEKSFGIKVRKGDPERLIPTPRLFGKQGARCRDLHEMVVRLCIEQQVPVPHSSWTRVKLCIMRACRARAKKVRPEAWLVDDVGCC
jgi:hypothetical protein